eukprot:8073607-Alexandrium_andersonii.AAC.1
MCIRDRASPGRLSPPWTPRLAPPARAASPGCYRPPDPPRKAPPARRRRFWRAGGAFRGGPGG